jgi:hypothetical protein
LGPAIAPARAAVESSFSVMTPPRAILEIVEV